MTMNAEHLAQRAADMAAKAQAHKRYEAAVSKSEQRYDVLLGKVFDAKQKQRLQRIRATLLEALAKAEDQAAIDVAMDKARKAYDRLFAAAGVQREAVRKIRQARVKSLVDAMETGLEPTPWDADQEDV